MDFELLRKMMDCGLLIYKKNSQFILFKQATPTDSRTSITNDTSSVTHSIEFDTYGAALDKAKELIDWR